MLKYSGVIIISMFIILHTVKMLISKRDYLFYSILIIVCFIALFFQMYLLVNK